MRKHGALQMNGVYASGALHFMVAASKRAHLFLDAREIALLRFPAGCRTPNLGRN